MLSSQSQSSIETNNSIEIKDNVCSCEKLLLKHKNNNKIKIKTKTHTENRKAILSNIGDMYFVVTST